MGGGIDRRFFMSGLAGGIAAASGASPDRPPQALAAGLAFPEGVVTTNDGGALFVEIGAGRVSRVTSDGRLALVSRTGGGPNGMTVGADGALYIANNGGLSFSHAGGRWIVDGVPADYTGGSIQRLDPTTGALRTLSTGAGNFRLRGPNDIVCDEWGGLWFSDTGKILPRSRDNGGLYWVAADGTETREVAYPLLAPNGIALGADRRTLYVALSNLRQIVAYRLTGPGQVERENGVPVQRVVASIGGDLSFDNIAVEESGNIIVAAVRKGALLVINPAGEMIESVTVPDPIVTAMAFGGAQMRTLFVTLSGRGELITLDWPRRGLPPLHRL